MEAVRNAILAYMTIPVSSAFQWSRPTPLTVSDAPGADWVRGDVAPVVQSVDLL